jgi:hypothetical protein
MDEMLTFYGSEVKALDDSGKVGGYLVRFTDASRKDLSGEYFTTDTYLGSREGDGADTLFHHGKALKFAKSVPAETVKALEPLKDHIFAPVTTKKDEIGIWAETVLNMADEYEAVVFDMVKKKKLGWSSGAIGHMVKKADDGQLLRWPIGEASLTPQPCEPMNRAMTLKSLDDMEYRVADGSPEETPIEQIKLVDGDALFNDSLRQTEQQTWELWSAVQTGSRKIVDAALSSDITGVEVNVREAVTALVGAYAPRLTEAIILQVTDFLASETRDEHFYLKSVFDDLDAPAASKFSDHLETVLAAAREVNTRAKSIQELRVKSGRVLSDANRTRLSALLEGLQGCAGDIEALLAETSPAPKSVNETEILSLLAEFEHTTMLIDTAPMRN